MTRLEWLTAFLKRAGIDPQGYGEERKAWLKWERMRQEYERVYKPKAKA